MIFQMSLMSLDKSKITFRSAFNTKKIFMRKLLFLGLILFFISCKANSDTPQKIISNFFEIYETKKINDALNYIFQTNEYLTKHSQIELEHVKESLHSLLDVIGNYYGYEILSQNSIGENIIHYCYIVKYDTQPVRFNFIFYKPSDTWVLYNFNFDNNIMDELDEVIKIDKQLNSK
jgi:hypothetical protein